MHLTLHLTDRCNLACRYCYQRHGTKRMSFETAMAAIEECTRGEENCGIIFFGGEPLLEEDLIFGVIDECERRMPLRFHYKVTTNGTMVTSDFLRELGANYLITSLNFQADWDERAKKALWKSYKKLGAWYLDAYRHEEKFYFAAFDKRIASHVWPGRGGSCLLGKRQISVSPDGVYYPCVQFVGHDEFALGRVGDGLDAARRTCVFERNERMKPSCAGCALLGRCNNRCGCLNLSTTGTIDEVPPFHCEHERFLIPFADRLAETLFKERNALFLQRHYNPAFPIASILEDMQG